MQESSDSENIQKILEENKALDVLIIKANRKQSMIKKQIFLNLKIISLIKF